MFEVNDYVIHNNKGVCRITDISKAVCPESNGETLCYILQQHESAADTFVTSVSSDRIIRKIISRNEAIELLDRVPYIRTVQAPKEKIRNALYTEAMSRYDCLEWIKVIKTIHIRQKSGPLTDMEIAFSSAAKAFFHAEISASLNIHPDEVENYIVKYVKNSL